MRGAAQPVVSEGWMLDSGTSRTDASGIAAPPTAPSWLRAAGLARVLAGGLMIAAVLLQLGVSLTYWHRIGLRDVGSRVVDFFSAFTHDGVLGGGIVLVVAGVVLLARGAVPTWSSVLRLAFLPSVLIAGLVYNLLLRLLPVPAGSQLDWANEVLHVVAPLAVLLDWIVIVGPRPLPWRAAAVVAVLPIAWLAWTFLRAPLVPDEIEHTPYYYPYGFLDPHIAGWAPVVRLVAVLLLLAVVLGVLGVLVQRIRVRRRAGRPAR